MINKTQHKTLRMLPMVVRKENLAVAFSIIGGIPAKNFDLQRFCSIEHHTNPKPTCGTIGCTLGWLSMHPYFKAQGLYLDDGSPRMKSTGMSRALYSEEAAEYLFGRTAFEKYFSHYGGGIWDNDLIRQEGLQSWNTTGTTKADHKKLALARLKRGYKRIH